MPGFTMSFGNGAVAKSAVGMTGKNANERKPTSKLDCFRDDEGPKRKTFLTTSPRKDNGGEIGDSKMNVEPVADSLDDFMAKITVEAAKPVKLATGGQNDESDAKDFWDDLQQDDPVTSYYEAYEKQQLSKKRRKPGGEGESDVDQDEDAEDIDEENGDRRTKPIDPLPAVDHSAIEYDEIRQEFYTPHKQIEEMPDDQVDALRSEMRISATGSNCPKPVTLFGYFGLPGELLQGIQRHGYTKPTPIQSQAIPAGLSGRDVIGIAETGSGKTVAYLMPLLVHAKGQPPLRKDQGPIGLVLCPTRELAIQIEKETYKFNKLLGLRSTTLTGGLSKYQQFKEMKRGSEIVIGTPGRVIDIIKMKGCNLQRCTFFVLDEADRMLHMGFEPQIRSIAQNIRPARQTLFFSATFPPKIEAISKDLLQNPLRITIGKLGQAAENVAQFVEVLPKECDKLNWLTQRIDGMLSLGQVLIFAESKQKVDELQQKMSGEMKKGAVSLHGDLDQNARMQIMDSFRKQKVDILIATDIAARGLDVATIRTVVSFDVARDIQTHTHRVGRTGRAGEFGKAYTLLALENPKNRKMAALLVDHLSVVGSPVGEALLTLAMRHAPFRASRLNPSTQTTGKAVESTSAETVADLADQRPHKQQRSSPPSPCTVEAPPTP